MGSEIWVAIISTTIAGVFQLVGRRMELGHAGAGATAGGPGLPPVPIPPTPTSPDKINYGLVVRQVGILQLAINLIAFVVGFALGASGAESEEVLVVALILGTVLLIIGFVWASLKVERASMWKHLSVVAVGVAVVTVITNAIVLQVPLTLPLTLLALVFALVQTFISMGIGGLIANRIRS